MRQQFQAFCEIDEGATVIEYALLASVVAIAAFAAIVNLGDTLEALFGYVSNGVNNSI
jgi:Flp pilus assembly pilin Flp